ncbi:MAG: Lsr2 family protein [Actinobacteria bacterium]|nr:Lsr2 family protein [Actinomycetota bacterium]
MARETITQLIDDLDGSPADRTVRFSWDGQAYELELSSRNVAAFEDVLQPYLAAARSVSSPGQNHGPSDARTRVGRPRSKPRSDIREIRAWAQANGYQVTDRGRIPDRVMEAYEAAH